MRLAYIGVGENISFGFNCTGFYYRILDLCKEDIEYEEKSYSTYIDNSLID